jgi:fido (protein-threonine AMPylation protein)
MSLLHMIPGQTPIDDVSELKIKGIYFQWQLDAVEADNILKAQEKYFPGTPSPKEAPFDLAWVLKLHWQMLGDVWEYAGRLRTKPVQPVGVAPEQIESQLYELLQNLPFWKDSPLVNQVAELHHKAVFIHPFKGGNGRWSRMLANIWLARNGGSPTTWPKDVGTESPIRDEYMKSLHAADLGDYEPLVGLHARYTPTS